MHRLFRYVIETGSLPEVGAIEDPRREYDSRRGRVHATFEHERQVTKSINELAARGLQPKDYSTFNFLQWYVAEQHEEESLFKGILDRIRLIGAEGRGLFHIDNELAKQVGVEPAPVN